MSELNKVIAAESGSELEEIILSKAAKNFYGRSEGDTFDLFPFYSILVSAGTNRNTDHFDPIELWRAKNSPIDKPVNIGHTQTRIIGHIMDCIAVDKDLKPIPEDTKEGDIPERLHIVTSAVIYKIWEDPKVQAEVNTLIDKISKGQIFVSMECLFRDFDYLLTNAIGEQKLIPRNKDTAVLTKHLRQYKGSGKIYNYTLARLLKNITFSAVGIVENPANPESVISEILDLFSNNNKASANNSVYINIDCLPKTEIAMSETIVDIKNTSEYKSLEATIASLQAENDRLKRDNDVIHSSIADYKVQLEKAKADKDEDDEDTEKEMASLKTEVASLKDEKVKLTKANDALNATIDEFKKASRHTNRAEAMMNIDKSLTREVALQSVAKYDELSDTSFAAMLDMFKNYASRSPKEITPETILNGAKAEKDVPMGTKVENDLQKTSADIKNWFKTTHEKKGS